MEPGPPVRREMPSRHSGGIFREKPGPRLVRPAREVVGRGRQVRGENPGHQPTEWTPRGHTRPRLRWQGELSEVHVLQALLNAVQKPGSSPTTTLLRRISIIPPLYFFFCFLFRATPTAYGGSQARSPIGAAAANLHHSQSNARSEPRLRPTPQLTAMPDP